MKILANKDIKNLFLAVSVIWAASLLLAQGFLWLRYQRLSLCLLFIFLLAAAAIWVVCCSYFKKQNKIMEQAVLQINAYLDGNSNARIECDSEGELYRLFHSVNSLAAVLNAHADNELREKEFLNRYFIVKDRSGLDCSDVLLDYFAQVDDARLLDSVHIPRIAKIAVFDQKLANRLVDAACKEAANPTKNKKEAVAVNKAVCTFLGACLQKTARADQEEFFEEVLALKDRLFKATGAKESATAASLGGGNIYVPSELSRLNYYSAKKKLDKFNHLFINYIAELQKKYEGSREEKIAMLKAMEAKLKEAKESGNEAEYQAARKLNAMMAAFSSIDDYYTSTSMIENVERYEDIYTGEKDAAYKDRVAGWYVFLHQLSPSAKTAAYVADKLLALDKKGQAKEVLTLGLKDGSSAAGVEEGDVKACQAKLDELK